MLIKNQTNIMHGSLHPYHTTWYHRYAGAVHYKGTMNDTHAFQNICYTSIVLIYWMGVCITPWHTCVTAKCAIDVSRVFFSDHIWHPCLWHSCMEWSWTICIPSWLHVEIHPFHMCYIDHTFAQVTYHSFIYVF